MTRREFGREGAIATPIPGLINPRQVKDAVRAIAERPQLDLSGARSLNRQLDPVRGQIWANLSPEYQWLREWVRV